tara:strand:- start:5355 stop:5639 length:285 start_codon:yes stop_codon:yes gene_type:complete
MSIEDKKVGIDIDSDGKPDLNLDLKTLILLIGGISSLIFTYTTLQTEIESAKLLPPAQDISKVEQKIEFLENKIENIEKQQSRRLDNIEKKVFK